LHSDNNNEVIITKKNIMKNLNVNTVSEGIDILTEKFGAVEFETRDEVDYRYGNEIIKVVGMDSNFQVLGYAIVEVN
jgi:hypothetical protein